MAGMFSSAIESVHFTGTGGTAMASAAVAMFDQGFTVTGYDEHSLALQTSLRLASPVKTGHSPVKVTVR